MSIHPTAFIHPLADVESGATIGAYTKIWRWSHIMPGAVIGKDCVIGEHCYIATDVVVGDHCHIQNGVNLYDGVRLGNSIFFGPNATTTNVKFPRSHRKGKFEETIFKDNCTIGAGCVIICGVTIEEWVMVGANSIVTKSLPPGVTAFGNPATVKRTKTKG